MRNTVPKDAPPIETQLEQTQMDVTAWLPMMNASNPDGRNYILQQGKTMFYVSI
jgi:hypothetical protein